MFYAFPDTIRRGAKNPRQFHVGLPDFVIAMAPKANMLQRLVSFSLHWLTLFFWDMLGQGFSARLQLQSHSSRAPQEENVSP